MEKRAESNMKNKNGCNISHESTNDQDRNPVIFHTLKFSISKYKSYYKNVSIALFMLSLLFCALTFQLGHLGLSIAIFLFGLSVIMGISIKYGNIWENDKKDWKALIIFILSCFVYGICLYCAVHLFLDDALPF